MRITKINSAISVAMVIFFVLLLSSAVMSTDDYMGSYTGKDAASIGTDKCIMCHRDRAPGEDDTHVARLEAEGSDYVGKACESCHGPGGNHNGKKEGILNPSKTPQADVVALCTSCHEEKGKFKLSEWTESKHNEVGNSCVTCHSGHSKNAKFLIEEKVKDVCNTCHEDKVTAAAAGTHGGGPDVSCAMCHNPHK